MENELISTTEAATLLGVSRITVFKKIKSGEIKAMKVGRNFVIRRDELLHLLDAVLSNAKKREIEQAVRKAMAEYGETFRRLGRE